MTFENGSHSRRIFHQSDNNHYDSYQRQAILDLQSYIGTQDPNMSYDEPTLLRYLYSSNFKLDQAYRMLTVLDEWQRDPSIQRLTKHAKNIIDRNEIYTVGTDKVGRPVIYIELTLMDFKNNSMSDYYCAFNEVTNRAMETHFRPGVIENWIVIVNTSAKLLLPVHLLESINKKLSIIYCGRLEKMFIVNVHPLIQIAYEGCGKFLASKTQNKITLLKSNQLFKLQEYIHKDELVDIFGGVRSIRPESAKRMEKLLSDTPSTNYRENSEICQSQYFSIPSEPTIPMPNGCCASQCSIF